MKYKYIKEKLNTHGFKLELLERDGYILDNPVFINPNINGSVSLIFNNRNENNYIGLEIDYDNDLDILGDLDIKNIYFNINDLNISFNSNDMSINLYDDDINLFDRVMTLFKNGYLHPIDFIQDYTKNIMVFYEKIKKFEPYLIDNNFKCIEIIEDKCICKSQIIKYYLDDINIYINFEFEVLSNRMYIYTSYSDTEISIDCDSETFIEVIKCTIENQKKYKDFLKSYKGGNKITSLS